MSQGKTGEETLGIFFLQVLSGVASGNDERFGTIVENSIYAKEFVRDEIKKLILST